MFPMSTETPEEKLAREEVEAYYKSLNKVEVCPGRFVDYCTMMLVDEYGNGVEELPRHKATIAELADLCDSGDFCGD